MLELFKQLYCTPLWISLRVGLSSTVAALVVGVGLSYAIAHLRPGLRKWIESAVLLPLVLPPTVLGYYLLVVIGRRGGRKDTKAQDPSQQVRVKAADRLRLVKMKPVVDAPSAPAAKEGGAS